MIRKINWVQGFWTCPKCGYRPLKLMQYARKLQSEKRRKEREAERRSPYREWGIKPPTQRT